MKISTTLPPPIEKPFSKPSHLFLGKEFFRYFLVSLLALTIDAGGLFILVEKFSWHYLYAAVCCFTLGSFAAFVLSTVWVFDSHSFRRWHDGFLAFTAIGLVGLMVNVSLIWTLTELGDMPYMTSKGIAALGSFSLNFILRKITLFTTHTHTE